MILEALSSEWVTLYSGPQAMAEMLRDVLREEHIPAFVPDSNLQQLHGPRFCDDNVFDARLLVSREHLSRARELVAVDPLLEARATEVSSPLVEREERVRYLGEKIAWCFAFPYFAPYGLWLARRYFAMAGELGSRPAGHTRAVAATIGCALESALLPVVVFLTVTSDF